MMELQPHEDVDPFVEILAKLRSKGETLVKLTVTNIPKHEFIELERLINYFYNELNNELRNDKGRKVKKVVLSLINYTEEHLIPAVSVLSSHAQDVIGGKANNYTPNDIRELYEMIKPIGRKLRDLPGDIPEETYGDVD